MTKKNFSQGIEAILKPTQKSKSVKSNPEMIRTTFRMNAELMEKLKALAYWERKTTTQLVSEALEEFIRSKANSHINEAKKNFKNKL